MLPLTKKAILHKKEIYSFLNYYIFTIFEALIGFYTISYLTKNIVPEDFGMIGIFTSIIFFLPAAITFSSNSLQAIQIINLSDTEYLNYRNEFLSFILINSGILFAVAIFTSLLLENYQFVLIAAFFAGFLQNLSHIHATELIQHRKPTKYGLFTTSTACLSLLLTIVFISYCKLGWEYRIIAIILTELIIVILRFFAFSDIGKTFSFGLSSKQFKSFITYGYPLMFAIVAGWILNQSDRYFVLSFFDLKIVGLYSAAAGIAKIIMMINQTMIKVLSPIIYKKLYEQKGRKFIIKVQLIFSFIILFVAFFLCVCLNIAGDKILGDKYLKAMEIIYIMVFAKAIFGVYSISSLVIDYYKKTKLKSLLTSLSALFVIIFSFSLIPVFKIYGPAIASLLSFIILTVLSSIYSNKLFNQNNVV